MKDLIILVPDNNIKFGLLGLFTRQHSLKTRSISADIIVFYERDPGIYKKAGQFLRLYANLYSYALVFLDHIGCGQESKSNEEICEKINQDLHTNSWTSENSDVIVLDPELEIWAWVESPHTAQAMGEESYDKMKNILIAHQLWEPNNSKPNYPKEAMECILSRNHIPRSSSIYKEIAEKASADL